MYKKCSRVAIGKRCLNSGQIDIISIELFSLNHRHFSRRTHGVPDMRWLYMYLEATCTCPSYLKIFG